MGYRHVRDFMFDDVYEWAGEWAEKWPGPAGSSKCAPSEVPRRATTGEAAAQHHEGQTAAALAAALVAAAAASAIGPDAPRPSNAGGPDGTSASLPEFPECPPNGPVRGCWGYRNADMLDAAALNVGWAAPSKEAGLLVS